MTSKRYSAEVVVGGTVSSTFRTAIGSTKNALHEVGGAVRQVEKRQRTLGRSIQTFGRMGKNVDRMRTEYVQLGGTLKRLEAQYVRLGAVQRATEANLARRAALQGKLFGAAGAAFAMALPIKAAVNFESTMADVKKVVNFETPRQFKQMGKDVLNLSQQMGESANDIGQIVAAAGQAGIARTELIGFARDAMKMGVAFDLTADQAGHMMATWRTGLQLTQPQVVALADKINYLGNTGAATAGQISTIVTKVGPFAQTAGLAAGKVAAIGSAMVSMGAQQDVAATAIKRMSINLIQGKAATTNQKEAFEALGMSAAQVAKDMQKDASGTIVRVFTRIKQLPKAMQGAVITKLFGSESVQAIAPLLTNLELLKEDFHKVGDASLYTGSMQKEYAARIATTEHAMKSLKERTRDLGITMGSVLLPTVSKMSTVLGKGVVKVADLSDKYPTLTKVVVGATAGLVAFRIATIAGGYAFTFLKGGVLSITGLFARLRTSTILSTIATKSATVATRIYNLAVGGARAGVAASIGLFGRLRKSTLLATAATKARTVAIALGSKAVKIATVTTRLFGVAWKLALGPIGWAIAAVTIGAVLVIKYWKPISAFFTRLWSGIKEVAGAVWGWMKQATKTTVGAIGDAWSGAINFIVGLWDGLKNTVTSVFDWIGKKIDWFVGKWEGIKNTVGGLWGTITGNDDETPKRKGAGIGRTVAASAVLGASFMTPAAAGMPDNQPMAAPAPASYSDHSTTTITVHAAPGMDEKKLAEHVVKTMDEHKRRQARGALYD